MRVLVTGGAGYIGSHTVVRLAAAGHQPVIVDSFVNAKPAILPRLCELTGQALVCHRLDVRDAAGLDGVFAAGPIDAVIHFAGLKAVGESVADPLRYYRTNLEATFTLLEAMARHGVGVLVFSSSATVYGDAAPVPMREDLPRAAANPYGWTKAMIEQVLVDVAAARPQLAVAALRYFNPVGAHPSGLIGEDPLGVPNNLVPFLAQVAVRRRERLAVFGGDYPTPDGTCQRDYIHVDDLAEGHVAALDTLFRLGTGAHVWNLGTGVPTSVLQMLHAFERAVGRELPYQIVGRRAGDVAVSYADPSRAQAELGWRARRGIDEMCADVWRWQSGNPDGYPVDGNPDDCPADDNPDGYPTG